MATNIIIGVGGTGAKVVEAVLHATACGLGPKSLLVGFVDQDQSNGNVARARQLLATLQEARSVWRTTARPHTLGDESGLLSAHIAPLVQGAETWIPHQDQSITLARIFERDRMGDEDKHLFDLMFASGEREQTMALGEGYRGRPHLGAAALASAVEKDAEFWKVLLQTIRQAQGGDEIRLVLAGSVFGGTGAAGFPTLARLIRRRLSNENIRRNVRIGGALMLPYFGFEGPDDLEGHSGNVARTEELLLQSREALRYYHDLFSQEAVFDQLYFVGWEPYFQFPYHRSGSGEQCNPALLPELIAALGVCRFLTQPPSAEAGTANEVLISARQDAFAISWPDLPSPDPARPDEPYWRFGQMLRFTAAWKHWGGVIGERRTKIAKIFNVQRDPWYKKQGLAGVDFSASAPESEIRKLNEYLDQFLTWASAIQFYAKSAGLKFDLWDTRAAVERFNEETPNKEFVVLRADLKESEYPVAFDEIVVKKPTANQPPGSSSLTRRLNEDAFEGNHKGVGRVVAALHAYSALVD